MRILPLLLTLLLCACPSGENVEPGDDDDDTTEPDPAQPGCGDGVIDVGEECDDGEANSDTEPDACRTDCFAAHCGDEVIDSGEVCDDGSPYGGDGCTPICTAEDGQLEEEPNDTTAEAEDWTGGIVHGAITAADTDCFSFEIAACESVEARIVGECPLPATLTLHDPDGAGVAVGTPDADGCALLDPAQAPGARYAPSGAWTLCVSGLLEGEVPFYALEITVVPPDGNPYEVADDDDPDGDGLPNKCDWDSDGDGVDNDDDNCPERPNGPDMDPLVPSADGFLRQWLGAGPYTGTDSAQDCLPSDDQLVAEDDALVTPALGDAAGDLIWTVYWSDDDRLEYLNDYGHVGAPREVYNATYVYSATARDLTLGLGPDDGARVWLNHEQVMDEPGCQGTVVDYFTAEVSLVEGWNVLVVKVRDQGGGWGNYARFLDGETPVTDLEISLSPDGPWESNQEDADGDGQGDVCDTTPLGG